MTASITDVLPRILPKVKNPGRYLGGEANQIVKDPDTVIASIALVFPDVYEIGMSHNGTKVLYHLFNREADLAAERAFAPMPDMSAELRALGIPLYTLESYRSIADFTAIGISLQTELNYTNVPFVLEHGQTVGRLIYERLTALPDRLYGQGIGSNYQSQGLKLSKHFR